MIIQWLSGHRMTRQSSLLLLRRVVALDGLSLEVTIGLIVVIIVAVVGELGVSAVVEQTGAHIGCLVGYGDPQLRHRRHVVVLLTAFRESSDRVLVGRGQHRWRQR